MPVALEIIGRRAELDAVSTLLDPGRPGARTLVLESDAGMGKTTIWRLAVEDARGLGYAVLSCQPAEAEASLPFVALGDLLEPVLDPLRTTLAPHHLAALDGSLGHGRPVGAVSRLAVSRATLALVQALAQRSPVVIAIDDDQWLDAPTADVLGFVARRVAADPVRFLVTRRGAHGRPPVLDLERTLGQGTHTVLDVGPLGAAELDRVLRERLDLALPRPRLIELARISGGNPLYALEIARTAAAHQQAEGSLDLAVPNSLGTLLRDRLEVLSGEARDAILLAAASPRPTTALIERAADTGVGIAEALRAGVIEVDHGRIRFAHPLLASVAYETALPGERATAHKRLAALADDIEERARHLALATEAADEAVADTIEQAAGVAATRGAPEAAAELAEHAARLTPDAQAGERRRRLAVAADHHIAAGDPARGRALLTSLIADLEPGPGRADLLWRLADAVGDDLGESIRLCEQALVEAQGAPEVEAQVHTALGVFTWLAGDLQRAAGHCEASAACADLAGDDMLLAISLAELCHAQTVLGQPYQREHMDRALAIEAGLADFPPNMRPSFQLGVIRMYTDDLEGARPLLRGALQRAQASGDESARFTSLFRLAELELRAGNWAAASRHAEDAVAAVLQAGIEQEQSAVLMAHALVRAHVGDLDTARDEAVAALSIAESGGDRIVALRCRGVIGFVELSRGAVGPALDHLGPAASELRALGIGELSISGVLQNEIEALVAAGRLDEAASEIEHVMAVGRTVDRSWNLVVAERGWALVAAARGEETAARAHIAAALAAHERLAQPFELGRTLLAQGQIERRFKRRGDARAALARALDVFDTLGAARWAERTADELARIPGRAPASGALTETERRVAELVAAGMSNKEIAAALFLSVRTIEANLSKAFIKLGVHSRTELVIRLSRPEASPGMQNRAGFHD